MKKRYLFLLQLCIISMTAAFARHIPGDVKTSFAAGDQMFISAQYDFSGRQQTALYMNLVPIVNSTDHQSYDRISWVDMKGITPEDDYIVTLEDAEQEILGYPAYYLKLGDNNYLYVGTTNSTAWGTYTYWVGKKYAVPFAIVPVTDTKTVKYTAGVQHPDDAFYLVALTSDKKPLCVSSYYSGEYSLAAPVISTYFNCCTWLTFEEVINADEQSYLEKLIDLFNVHSTDYYHAGSSPGCYEDTAAVEEFYAAMEAIHPLVEEEEGHTEAEYEAGYNRLAEAVKTLENLKPVPLTAGYYIIRPGLTDYGGRDGGKCLLGSVNRNIYIVNESDYNSAKASKASILWQLIIDEETGYAQLRNVANNTYICNGTSYNFQWKILGQENIALMWMYSMSNGSFLPDLYYGSDYYTYYLIPYVPYGLLYYHYTGNEVGGGATYFFEAVSAEEAEAIEVAARDKRLKTLITTVETTLAEANEAFIAAMDQTVVNNLKNALAASKAIETGQTTQADIDALQAAYDAFLKAYQIGDVLAALVEKADLINNGFAVGEGLGYYPFGTNNVLDPVIREANTLLSDDTYTPDQIIEVTKRLNEAMDEMKNAVNSTPDTDKWYTINFASEAEYDEFGWDKANAEGLFGKTATIATDATTILKGDDARSGAGLFCMIPLPNNKLMSEFRFIQVGNKYAIQNHATGLFLHLSGATVTADIVPSLFTVTGKGAGKVILTAYDLATDEQGYVLHVQKNGAKVVGWTSTDLGTNSALSVVEVGDMQDEELGINIDVPLGIAQVMTFPYDIKHVSLGQIYRVAGKYTQDEKIYIGLKEALDGIKGGEPFVYIANGSFDPVSDETAMETFFAGTEVASAAMTSECYLTGTFLERIYVNDNCITLSMGDDGEAVWEATDGQVVEALSGYIAIDDHQLPDVSTSDIDFGILLNDPEGIVDGIRAITLADRDKNVYDLSGRRLNPKTLKPGFYIINNSKVLIR